MNCERIFCNVEGLTASADNERQNVVEKRTLKTV